MSSSPAMDVALEELEGELERVGSPWMSTASPGLSVDEIERIVRPTGLSFPGELVALWEWRSQRPLEDTTLNASLLPGDFRFVPLDQLVTVYGELLSVDFLDDSYYVKTSWVPAFDALSRTFFAETNVGFDDPVPLTPVDNYDASGAKPLAVQHRLDSITELIRDMARLLREQHWGLFNLPDGREIWGWNPDMADVSFYSLGYRWEFE